MIIYLIFSLILICYYDIKTLEIPDSLVIAVALSSFYYGFHWAWIIPLFAFILCAFAAAALNCDMPFGMGDAKLLSALTLSFGFEALCMISIVSSLAAAVYALFLIISGKASKKDRIAFGPFIVLGFIFYFSRIY